MFTHQSLVCASTVQDLQQKRLAARRHNTTYCYDFPSVFENALRSAWAARAAAGEPQSMPPPGRLVEAHELVFANDEQYFTSNNLKLQRVQRGPGQNKGIGMVAWHMTLKTPECQQGRQIIAVANDITYQSGAFGPKEDALFRAAGELALEERLPLVYLAANSGARVGVATEVGAGRVAMNCQQQLIAVSEVHCLSGDDRVDTLLTNWVLKAGLLLPTHGVLLVDCCCRFVTSCSWRGWLMMTPARAWPTCTSVSRTMLTWARASRQSC